MAKKKIEFEVPQMPADVRINQVQKAMWYLVARIVRVVKDRYGEEGAKVIYEGLKNWENNMITVRKAGLDPGKVSLEDLVTKVFAPGDALLFTMKEKQEITEEPDQNRLLYRIKDCNVAKLIEKECPETCSIVAGAMIDGMTEAANPDFVATHEKFIAEGQDGCYVYVEKKPKTGKKKAK
ncbi:MAG: hypothetical protein Q7T04_08340 [Dehalococcoidia bacterium]|nr:hypothetical protein [Dehalococcoidia bacterium]